MSENFNSIDIIITTYESVGLEFLTLSLAATREFYFYADLTFDFTGDDKNKFKE